ncbi:hypothetical protein PAECIP111893_01701 [Paenibacillus plantiphilus]|uniref:SLH domain-containing protein n=1 Tax=Paenibacillus plantiphilus TaxID=2905650 RepID=A0ABN8GF26_9BACL|nr:chitobiase/beta-hexosaminidase C-terminal domain-containing protein [Paenibacillus plantiphilus]CAH1201705.1 hypothetical protein PAECIP111893_01701 [Paenibacillus plantiphilus]
MRKRTSMLSLIIVLCVALFPGTLLAAVTVSPVTGSIHPGSPINITGTSDLSQVIIKVYRPDHSILYFNVAKVESGVYNDTITLGANEAVGTYQIQVGQGEQISTTSVEVTAALIVAAPTASPASGVVASGTSVTLSSATEGAAIYYTVDGSNPTRNSLLYNAPIVVSSAVTIKAIAVHAGMVDSGIMSASYTIRGITAAPTASPAAGAVASGTSVTLSSLTQGAAIYYTIDGSNPTRSSTLYSAPIIISSAQTIKAIAVHEGMADSGIMSASYSITSSSNSNASNSGAGQSGPAASSETDISGSTGGVAERNRVKVQFPSNVISGNMKVKIEQVTDTAGLLKNPQTIIVGDVYSITKDKPGDFDKSVTITMFVDVTKLDISKYSYAIHWFNEATGEWVILDNPKINPTTGEISGDVNHFTKFAVLATEKEAPAKTVLKDIKGHWAEKKIQQLVDLGAITGYPDGSFLPNKTITRAEFVQVLIKAFALEQQGDQLFLDTKGHWAAKQISTAVANGIVTGYDADHFGPNDPITREQIALMIMRAAELAPETDLSALTDKDKISPWAQGSVAALVKAGIITGYSDGSFRPLNSATRAEAVTMITNSLEQ